MMVDVNKCDLRHNGCQGNLIGVLLESVIAVLSDELKYDSILRTFDREILNCHHHKVEAAIPSELRRFKPGQKQAAQPRHQLQESKRMLETCHGIVGHLLL